MSLIEPSSSIFMNRYFHLWPYLLHFYNNFSLYISQIQFLFWYQWNGVANFQKLFSKNVLENNLPNTLLAKKKQELVFVLENSFQKQRQKLICQTSQSSLDCWDRGRPSLLFFRRLASLTFLNLNQIILPLQSFIPIHPRRSCTSIPELG